MDVIPALLIILVAAFTAGAIAHRLGLPALLGFVLAGVALGPYTGGITVSELVDAQALSEVGVALLLFALGVEFSLTTLRPVSPLALAGVPVQMLLTLFLGLAAGYVLGWQATSAFWFAALIVLSSPVLTLHTLRNLQLEDTPVAQLARRIIIVQNLAFVPLLFILRQVQDGTSNLPALALAVAEALVFLAFLLFLGVHVLPRLYAYIARQDSSELSLLVVLASAAVVVYGTYLYSLSFVEVAFLIGLVLSQSELGTRALSTFLSIRDLFGVLFFVSAGMLLDLTFLTTHIVLVLGLLALVTVGKMLILAGVARLFGRTRSEALTVGLTLFQLSELSFVLAGLALAGGAIDDDLYSLVITVGLLTMLLTPFSARLALRLSPQPSSPSPLATHRS
jgi:monovalent cation:H+ antiporter-2, CPA2 family